MPCLAWCRSSFPDERSVDQVFHDGGENPGCRRDQAEQDQALNACCDGPGRSGLDVHLPGQERFDVRRQLGICCWTACS